MQTFGSSSTIRRIFFDNLNTWTCFKHKRLFSTTSVCAESTTSHKCNQWVLEDKSKALNKEALWAGVWHWLILTGRSEAGGSCLHRFTPVVSVFRKAIDHHCRRCHLSCLLLSLLSVAPRREMINNWEWVLLRGENTIHMNVKMDRLI